MNNIRFIKEWIKKSWSDLKTAEYNLKGRKNDAAAFYSQQSTEKALKALQIARFGKFDKIHDLILLAKSVEAPEAIINECRKINPFYVITRYADVEELFDEIKPLELVKSSKRVFLWVKEMLNY